MAFISIRRLLVDLTLMPRWTVLLIGFLLGFIPILIIRVIPWQPVFKEVSYSYTYRLDVKDFQHTFTEGLSQYSPTDNRLSRAIHKQVRVLCWIMIKERDNVKANATLMTWARRCDVLLLFGRDKRFNAIDVGVKEGRLYLARKTFASLTYIFKNHINDADWFIKADDDTYVIMENLKYFLSGEDPNDPVYFGEYYNPAGARYVHYNGGGAGYVMSREALRRFGEEGPRKSMCTDPAGAEDRTIGYCLYHLRVRVGDSTDRWNKSRFHYDTASLRADGDFKPWYKTFMDDRFKKGIESMSRYPISFHYLQHYDIHMLEYLVYTLAPFGIVKAFPEDNS